MATGKLAAKPSEADEQKSLPLGPSKSKMKKIKRKMKNKNKDETSGRIFSLLDQSPSASGQRNFFLDQFQSANGVKLSSLELESIKDSYFIKLSEELSRDASYLGKHVKFAFGSLWKEVLSDGQLVEGKIDPGSPAVLVISASAIRSLELLRGLKSLTKECPAAKLFSKHMKVEEQVSMLSKRVNIASGTPSRIKKLCEMDALGLSRLTALVLDMQTDVKGYSLFTLTQVRDEFWDLYKNYFHQRLLQGDLRLCLYGPIPVASEPNEEEIAKD